MSVAREVNRAQQMREKARHLTEAAERTGDPEQRHAAPGEGPQAPGAERAAGRPGEQRPPRVTTRHTDRWTVTLP